MKISFFDAHKFEKDTFTAENESYGFDINFIEAKLSTKTASLAAGSQVACSFVNDKLDASCLKSLHELGVSLVALRSAGFNHVDINSAETLGITISRVPGYSPHAVAEYTVGLLLNLNRKIHKSYLRVRELNFSLDGLVGFDLCGKTVGILGTGKIGSIVAQILSAFGCRVLCNDKFPDESLKDIKNIQYVDYEKLYKESDVISLHVPLTPETHHILNENTISQMKKEVFIINTGRGALIDSKALINALKSGHVKGAALDVYEEEEDIFFQDVSDKVLQDDTLARLLTFPNVLISSHQAFLTQEALTNIARTTLNTIDLQSRGMRIPEDRIVTSKCFQS